MITSARAPGTTIFRVECGGGENAQGEDVDVDGGGRRLRGRGLSGCVPDREGQVRRYEMRRTIWIVCVAAGVLPGALGGQGHAGDADEGNLFSDNGQEVQEDREG